MQIEFRVDGCPELIARLAALGGDVEKAVEQGLSDGAKAVQHSAKKLCPVDTGALRNSIVTQKEAARTVSIGTNMEYAVCVEFGTGQKGDPAVEHTIKEKWVYRDDRGQFHTSHGQRPQPFLTPALRLSENRVQKRFRSAIQKAIRERSTGK